LAEREARQRARTVEKRGDGDGDELEARGSLFAIAAREGPPKTAT